MHDEGVLLHLGINYVLSPPPEINKQRLIAFQQAILNAGVDYDRGELTADNGILILKKTPPLQIKIGANIDAPIGQLLIIANPNPTYIPDEFSRIVDMVIQAFRSTWTGSRQILSCDASIRYLYQASGDHAFQELWVTRLRQPEASLSIFGRPILGGGLRFVMPHTDDGSPQIEIKIESYLGNTKQFFIEAIFKWVQTGEFKPTDRITEVDRFIENQVKTFIQGNNHD